MWGLWTELGHVGWGDGIHACQVPCSVGQSQNLEVCVCGSWRGWTWGDKVPCFVPRDAKFEPDLPVIIKCIYQSKGIEHILFNRLLD